MVLLGVQAALSAAAATLEWAYTCGACRAGGLSLGLLGFSFYGGLFLAALLAGPTRILYGGILLGLGVHAVLVAQLVATGQACAVCLAAAGVSLLLAALSVACDRVNLTRLVFILPWSLLLGLGWVHAPRPAAAAARVAVTDSAAVRLVVFTQAQCPYCDELRDRVLPGLEKEFGPRLQVLFRDAGDLPGIRRTPTIVIAPGRREREARIFEGLPETAALRAAILEVERLR